MAVTISPQAVTDLWTEYPTNTTFDATAERLQMLLFGIFHLLELECQGSEFIARVVQEAHRLTLDMKFLGEEMQEKLKDAEREKCKPEPDISPTVDALQKEVAGLRSGLEATNEEKSHLENLIADMEENLRAAKLDVKKLKSSMEHLDTELKEKKKLDEAIDRILEVPEDAVEEDAILEWQLLKDKLRLLRDLEDECEDAKQILWNVINSFKTQQASLIEQTLLLDAALNISVLSNLVAKDELLKAEKVKAELIRKTKEELAVLINNYNFKELHSQSCARLERNSLSYKVDKLNQSLTEHSLVMENVFVTAIPTLGEDYNRRLRMVQRGRLKGKALLEACKEGDADAALVLLKNKANPNICDEQGLTPLQWSAKKGYLSVAEVLIEHGRIINIDNPVAGCMIATPLHLAALEGHAEMAKLFLDLGADINAETRDASTPLHLAVHEGRYPMVKLLVSRGANLKKKNHIGNTPLDLARVKKYDTIQQFLLRNKIN